MTQASFGDAFLLTWSWINHLKMGGTQITKRFFNAYDTIVQDSIDGLIASAGTNAKGQPRLVRLDGYPHIKVVLRGDWEKDKVAIISGGGAGHEPAHAGFVGQGMLTAAVSGEIFASPSVEAVFEAIRSVTGPAGCLLLVKNYTGDRLNFGLAAERAKQLGLAVEMVIVGDDVAIPDSTQPRGVAGTLFVHKYAGYLSEQGESLSGLKTKVEAFANRIYSLGMSLSTCSQPGRAFEERLEDDEAELGLGIHGEPGRSKVQMQSASHLVGMLLEQLERSFPANDHRYAILINNLGAVPPMEMNLIVNEVMGSPIMDRVDYLFGPGHLMTALNMNGFSISLVAVDAESIPALLAEVGPPAWLPAVQPAKVTTIPRQNSNRGEAYSPSENAKTRAAILAVRSAILDAEADLNALDAKVGDGDAGSTFASGAKAIADRIDSLPLADTPALFKACGAIIGEGMGGSSGILLSIFFNASANAMSEGATFSASLWKGVEQMQFYGGAKEGGRTMLDAMIPALREFEASGDLTKVLLQAEAGAARTAEISTTSSGRSAYLIGSDLLGTVDPGAKAMALILKAITDAMK